MNPQRELETLRRMSPERRAKRIRQYTSTELRALVGLLLDRLFATGRR